jgi:EpsI family protein
MNLLRKSLLTLALMFAAAAAAVVLRPTAKVADRHPAVDLASLIPVRFADWTEEKQSVALVVDPQQKAAIERIYSQTLSRVYVNAKGYRIMLSIAYGDDQSDARQLHKPEVCYPAQGFQILEKTSARIDSPFGTIPVTRIDAQLGLRREPVTYWTTVGDQLVEGGIGKKLAEMRYGFSGSIPDGLLFRVSSLDPQTTRAYEAQAEFVRELLGALTPEQRRRLAGIASQG